MSGRWALLAAGLLLAACGGKQRYYVGASSSDGDCDDGVRSGQETDIDCGGPGCPRCPTDASCERHGDCLSEVCRAEACRAPSCDDRVTNGGETDVDCGGEECPACLDGADCELSRDCVSLVCLDQACEPATCVDGVQNGEEVDIDCGGACISCERCDDGVLNGTETGVDCGGGSCARCALDQACSLAEDCESEVCIRRASGGIDNLCSLAECANQRLDQNETDIDCGGPDCGTCEAGQTCQLSRDCDGRSCGAFCEQPCRDASDCGSGAACEDGLCVYCYDASDCPADYCGDTPCSCRNGFCRVP